MNLEVIHTEHSGRLLLIFAGWGMDPNPFRQLRADGYDIAVAWDYADTTFAAGPLSDYSEIVVLAWSMGVCAASSALSQIDLPVTLSIAVNGTVTPVSDSTGIPVEIFSATLRGLTEASLAKFNRRMCGSAIAADQFKLNKPERDIESLRRELRAIGERATGTYAADFRWDTAIIGSRDMIFPAAAQRRAWQGHDIIEIDTPHLPDFQDIINRLLIKKDRIARCFAASRAGYDSHALLQHDVADRLVAKLMALPVLTHYNHAIEIGAGSGRLTEAYLRQLSFRQLELWDIAQSDISRRVKEPSIVVVTDDAEVRLRSTDSDSLDLVISASTLQWFNSPANGLREIERTLRPGGIAAIALYVEGTYSSFASETGVSLHYATPTGLLNALTHSDILLDECESHSVRFESTSGLLRHISQTGVSSGAHSSPASLRRIIADNRLRELEYNTFYLIFKKI